MEILDINKWKNQTAEFKYPAIIINISSELDLTILGTYLNGFKDDISFIKVNIYVNKDNKIKEVGIIDFTIENISKIFRAGKSIVFCKDKDTEVEASSMNQLVGSL